MKNKQPLFKHILIGSFVGVIGIVVGGLILDLALPLIIDLLG